MTTNVTNVVQASEHIPPKRFTTSKLSNLHYLYPMELRPKHWIFILRTWQSIGITLSVSCKLKNSFAFLVVQPDIDCHFYSILTRLPVLCTDPIAHTAVTFTYSTCSIYVISQITPLKVQVKGKREGNQITRTVL